MISVLGELDNNEFFTEFKNKTEKRLKIIRDQLISN
jgi:hypothetical protein